MKVIHKKLGIDLELPEILQGDLEAFEKELQPLINTVEGIQLAVYSGAVLRAAIKVGWLNGYKEEGVPSLKPSIVTFLSNKIGENIRDAREVPPE